MSVLTISFAIAMAFFLVIGMVAVGVTEFMGGRSDDQPSQQDPSQPTGQQGEDEEEELRDRIEEDPEDYSAHAQLAVLLGNTGRVEEAIPHYEQALQDDPDNVSLRLSFARMLEQRGFDLDAEVQFERVLEADEDNVEAMYMLGELMQRSQPPRNEEAGELFERVIETDPESFYAQMAEERLAEGVDDDGAENGDENGAGDDIDPDSD
jgi:cytochrome c-type biogenesis protein CcmH/NrfG